MAEMINEDNLMDEFEKLILEISQTIIDDTIMDDLNKLRTDLREEMGNFSKQATKINTITHNIDSLLTQTTVNMTEAVQNTSSELNIFLEETNEVLSSKLTHIVMDLDKILEGSTALIEEKFRDSTSEIREALVETTSSIESSVITTKKDVEILLEKVTQSFDQSSDRLDGSVSSIIDEINTIFDNNSNRLDQVIDQAEEKLNAIANTTNDRFSEEIKMLKDYLMNSDKLIKGNQNSIKDIQIRIEERLTETLVLVKDETIKNKFNFDQTINIIEELSEHTEKKIFGMTELNNTINIKEDLIIDRLKKHIKASKQRFLITTALNGLTLASILAILGYLVIKG